jgi:hypothetical protein
VIPFPSEDTTPPVTNINLTFFRVVIPSFFASKYRGMRSEKQTFLLINEVKNKII